ncbi:MAG: YdeI/OmpD-associated family protein [Cyanobacteria bacterium P01_H01_bin.162]
MQISTTHRATDQAAWRSWLTENHDTASEIWLIFDDRADYPTVSYLDSVYEAICFGWIDGIQKRASDVERAQRFTPRRPRSHWTELNKARARWLIDQGLMTPAGQAILPDLTAPFTVADDIQAAIKATPEAWSQFCQFPDLYIRVRISYIEEMRRNRDEFDRRLGNFLKKTAAGKLFGNLNDQGRLA